MFSSKTGRDLNHDPFPFVTYWDVTGTRGPQALWRSGNRVDGAGYFTKQEPRPEFDHVQHNAPNPILTHFRNTTEPGFNLDYFIDQLIRATGRPVVASIAFDPFVKYTAAQIDHARAVLTRLAAMTEER